MDWNGILFHSNFKTLYSNFEYKYSVKKILWISKDFFNRVFFDSVVKRKTAFLILFNQIFFKKYPYILSLLFYNILRLNQDIVGSFDKSWMWLFWMRLC